MEPSGSDTNYKSVRENCGSNGDVAVVLFLGFGAVEMCMDEERGKKKATTKLSTLLAPCPWCDLSWNMLEPGGPGMIQSRIVTAPQRVKFANRLGLVRIRRSWMPLPKFRIRTVRGFSRKSSHSDGWTRRTHHEWEFSVTVPWIGPSETRYPPPLGVLFVVRGTSRRTNYIP